MGEWARSKLLLTQLPDNLALSMPSRSISPVTSARLIASFIELNRGSSAVFLGDAETGVGIRSASVSLTSRTIGKGLSRRLSKT